MTRERNIELDGDGEVEEGEAGREERIGRGSWKERGRERKRKLGDGEI